MKKPISISAAVLAFCILLSACSFSQGVSINTSGASPDSSAMLDVSSTTKGFALPRMSTAERNAIISPVNGLMIFNTDCGNYNFYSNSAWYPVNTGISGIPYAAGNITGSASVCQGQTGVGFSISPVTGATNYTWSFTGSGFSITGGADSESITASFTGTASSGILSVYGFNTCGNGNSSSLFISVSPNSAVSLGITSIPQGSVCSGANITFTASPVNGGINPAFQWKNKGADITGATNSAYSSTSLVNNDTITCEMSSAASCISGNPAISNAIPVSVDLTAPSSLSVSHTSNHKEFTVSFNGGTCWGDVNIQYQKNGGTWSTLATIDGNSTQTNFPVDLPADGWYGASWSSVSLRLQRVNNTSQTNSFSSNLQCSATSGSSVSTLNVDEDCNNQWDNTTQAPGQQPGCGGLTCYTKTFYSVPACAGSPFSTQYQCCLNATTSPCYQSGCRANGGGSIKEEVGGNCTYTGTVTTYW